MAQDDWARGRRRRVAGTESPRQRAAGSRRSKPKSVIRGSNRSEFGSGVIYATWVIHWRQQLGTTGLEGTKAAAAVALDVGARRRTVYWSVPRTGPGLRKLAQKHRKVGQRLTEAWIGLERRAGVSGVELWRRCTSGARGKSRCRASPDLLIRRGGAYGRCEGVQGVRSACDPNGGEQSRRRSN